MAKEHALELIASMKETSDQMKWGSRGDGTKQWQEAGIVQKFFLASVETLIIIDEYAALIMLDRVGHTSYAAMWLTVHGFSGKQLEWIMETTYKLVEAFKKVTKVENSAFFWNDPNYKGAPDSEEDEDDDQETDQYGNIIEW